ncbi:MAG: glycoside hydrolase family 2 protein [Promethearchaeota archaeon]
MERILLNDYPWRIAIDLHDDGMGPPGWYEPTWLEEHVDMTREVEMPNSWQTIKGLEKYEGVCWYFARIPRDLIAGYLEGTEVVHLKFNGSNYISTAWLNGVKLGTNEGGYLPFSFHLKKSVLRRVLENNGLDVILAVRVDNTRRHDQIPEFSCDWFQWGGIYRDVYLEIKPEKHVMRCLITPRLTFHPSTGSHDGAIDADIIASEGLDLDWFIHDGTGDLLATGSVPVEREVFKTSLEGFNRFKISIPMGNCSLWSPRDPVLHTLTLKGNGETIHYQSRFGMREIKTRGSRILLNNAPITFKGSSLHEERFPSGREFSKEERLKDLQDMKSLGFNFLRTGHYSHDESLLEAADEIGMLIGEEIPVYWDIDYTNPKTQKLAVKMMRSLIHRDFNHPSVAWWSAGNEAPVSRKACRSFFKTVIDYTRKLDPSRLVVYVTKNVVYDPLRKYTDVVLVNAYFGWYIGSTRNWSFIVELSHAMSPGKPFVISEFGAGAKRGFGRRERLDLKFSEWKQASIVSHAIKVFNSKPFMSGWIIWIYRDFKSHMRLNKYQEGYNRKGLVDESGRKKLLALWMPRLVNEKYSYRPATTFIARFLSKYLWPLNAFIGILIDTLLPMFTRSRNSGYYEGQASFSQ